MIMMAKCNSPELDSGLLHFANDSETMAITR